MVAIYFFTCYEDGDHREPEQMVQHGTHWNSVVVVVVLKHKCTTLFLLFVATTKLKLK